VIGDASIGVVAQSSRIFFSYVADNKLKIELCIDGNERLPNCPDVARHWMMTI
jgi:hypothetical protein